MYNGDIWVPGKTPKSSGSRYRNAVVLTGGLVGYWRLGEAGGSVAVAEIGSNGTYIDNPTLGVAGALVGDANTCATFNATTQYVSVPDYPQLEAKLPGWSWSFWLNRASIPAGPGIFGKYIGGANGYDTIITATGTFRSGVRGPTGSLSDNSSGKGPNVCDGVWHHLVVTATDTSLTTYVDGTGYAPTVGTWVPLNNNGALIIGGRSVSELQGGTIDEVAIWNRTLTQADVTRLYAAGT